MAANNYRAPKQRELSESETLQTFGDLLDLQHLKYIFRLRIADKMIKDYYVILSYDILFFKL